MKEIKYKGKYLQITEEDIDGHIYERVRLKSGVRILPVRDNKILFIKEYRPIEKKSSLKLISGWVDKADKTILEIAKEELKEEVSMEAEKWKEFYCRNTDNHTVENKVTYFIAEDVKELKEKVENPDNDIIEEVMWLDEKKFWELLEEDKIHWFSDNLVVAMLFKILNKGNKNNI